MPRPTGWKDEYYVRVYELVRQGLSTPQAAEVLGVPVGTLKQWIKARPALRDAVRRGKADRTSNRGLAPAPFSEYVYRRLPPELQGVWDEIHKSETDPSRVARVEALLANQGKQARQALFFHALIHYSFNPYQACRVTGVSKQTLANWVADDPGFRELVDTIPDIKREYAEEALWRLVEEGVPAAVMYVNSALNKDRGFGAPRDVKVSGTVAHTHAHVLSLEELGVIPLDQRRAMLDEFRRRREGGAEVVVINPDPDPLEVTGMAGEVGSDDAAE